MCVRYIRYISTIFFLNLNLTIVRYLSKKWALPLPSTNRKIDSKPVRPLIMKLVLYHLYYYYIIKYLEIFTHYFI